MTRQMLTSAANGVWPMLESLTKMLENWQKHFFYFFLYKTHFNILINLVKCCISSNNNFVIEGDGGIEYAEKIDAAKGGEAIGGIG